MSLSGDQFELRFVLSIFEWDVQGAVKLGGVRKEYPWGQVATERQMKVEVDGRKGGSETEDCTQTVGLCFYSDQAYSGNDYGDKKVVCNIVEIDVVEAVNEALDLRFLTRCCYQHDAVVPRVDSRCKFLPPCLFLYPSCLPFVSPLYPSPSIVVLSLASSISSSLSPLS
jgi:hypothetical protein